MKSPRTTTEYRLLVQRTGNDVKAKRFTSLKALHRRIGVLTSEEPWRFYHDTHQSQKGPDDYACCAGTRYDECACGGLTMREATAETRKDLPPIESILVQRRTVTRTPWEESAVDPAILDDLCPAPPAGEP